MAHADPPEQEASSNSAPGSVFPWAFLVPAAGRRSGAKVTVQCSPPSVVTSTARRLPRRAAAQPVPLPVKQNALGMPLPSRPPASQPLGRAKACHDRPASRVRYRLVPVVTRPASADQNEMAVAAPASGCRSGAQVPPPSVVRKSWSSVRTKPVLSLTKSTWSTGSAGPRLCRQVAPWSEEMSKPAHPPPPPGLRPASGPSRWARPGPPGPGRRGRPAFLGSTTFGPRRRWPRRR